MWPASSPIRYLRYDGQTGAFLDVFASGGGLSRPLDVDFGPDGNLYVTSFFTNSILKFDGRTGDFLGTFAAGGRLAGPFTMTFVPAEGVAIPEPTGWFSLGVGLLIVGSYACWRRRMLRATLSAVGQS